MGSKLQRDGFIQDLPYGPINFPISRVNWALMNFKVELFSFAKSQFEKRKGYRQLKLELLVWFI